MQSISPKSIGYCLPEGSLQTIESPIMAQSSPKAIMPSVSKRSSEGFPVLEKRCLNSLQFMENRVKIGQPQKAPLRHRAEHPPQPPQLATPNRRMSKISGLVFSSKMETCREPSEVITAEQPVGSRIKGRKRVTWPKYGKQTLNLRKICLRCLVAQGVASRSGLPPPRTSPASPCKRTAAPVNLQQFIFWPARSTLTLR